MFNKYSALKMLEELTNFKTVHSPFYGDFFKHLDYVYRRHTQMLEKLQLHRKKLEKKLRYLLFDVKNKFC